MEGTVESIPILVGREEDGRWWADIESMPGVMAYGATREEAIAAVRALALRVAADCMEAERIVGPTLPLKPPVGTPLPRNLPPDSQQSSQQLLRLDRSPVAHATENTLRNAAGMSSP